MRASQIAWVLLLLTILVGRHPASADFVPLGDLPGGLFHSGAAAVSADGLVVVGGSISGESDESGQAFRWTSETGMVGLGFLSNDLTSIALGVSADGSVVVGQSSNPAVGGQAFRWTSETGMVGLGSLTGDSSNSVASGVSGDGSVVVGFDSAEAFRWTSATGMVSLGDLPGGDFWSSAHAISADGSVIVGQSESALGREAFRWTEAEGMVGLGDISGEPPPLGFFRSEAFAVSADGSVVVGRDCSLNSCDANSANEAFRWTEAEGMTGLGVLPGDGGSEAFAVSADGSVVVGSSYYSGVFSEAFIWDRDHGMRSLREVLIAQGDDLAGWQLTGVSGISADGRIIVGGGINPAGNTEAWLARLGPSGVLPVVIDIKPGSGTNAINPKSNGKIRVAVLATDTFDATMVQPSTVRFGSTGAEAAPLRVALKDVNRDRRPDLLLHFYTKDTGIKCGETSASLSGQTSSGQGIRGVDVIKTVGCK